MLIAPTTFTAYQFILTEPELQAALADPSVLLPHFKAALDTKDGEAAQRPASRVDPGPDESDPAGQKPNLRTATIRIHTNDWVAFCAELARLYPHYQTNEGEPDKFHIALTARRCGFSEITEDNFQQVVATLIAHAQESHPAPA